MMGLDTIYAGFECQARGDWKQFAAAPKAPSNYGAEAAEKYLKTKGWPAKEADAPFEPLTGQVVKACLLDEDGGRLFEGLGGEAYDWICKRLNTVAPRDSKVVRGVRIVGIHPRRRLHLCAVDAALAGKLAMTWGLRVKEFVSSPELAERVTIFDPVKAMCGKSYGDFEIGAINRLLGDTQVPGYPHALVSASDQAHFVRDACLAFGLNEPLL